MREEKLKVLKMVAEGKVSPEEGLELIESLGSSTGDVCPEGKGPRKMIVVSVVSSDGDKVNIKVPLNALDLIEPFITAYVPGIKDKPDIAEKISHLRKLKDMVTDATGTIVNISSEEGDVVKISVLEEEGTPGKPEG